jgi:hypothetical protein
MQNRALMAIPRDLAALMRHATQAGDRRLVTALQTRLAGATVARPPARAAFRELVVGLGLRTPETGPPRA